VLVSRDLAEPVAIVQAVLDRAGIDAQAQITSPSLEDVFVTATSTPPPADGSDHAGEASA
jgi:hypothetical protein